MNTTRLTTEEALALNAKDEYTDNHVLVINEKRLKFRLNMRGEFRPFYELNDRIGFFDCDELKALYKAGAHVELETPSPFDDEAFKGWESFDNGRARTRPNSGSTLMIYLDGSVYLHGFRYTVVPTDKIPEAARLINQLLALGEK